MLTASNEITVAAATTVCVYIYDFEHFIFGQINLVYLMFILNKYLFYIFPVYMYIYI